MNTKKMVFSLMLAFAITFMQIGAVAAQSPTPPLTGTVNSISLQTNTTTGVTTVLVTYTDALGATQSAILSVETAAALGLVKLDPITGMPAVNDPAIGQPVTIDPITVIPDTTTTEKQHPVGSKLSDFFKELLGVDYDTIMAVHNDGAGFGVIAQALWMTNKLGGDATTFQAIIDAKKSGDYSGIMLADGSTSTATNWGQFKKEVGDKGNLGSVMSGKASNGQTQNSAGNNNNSNGKSGNPGNGNNGNHGNGNSNGKGKGKP